MRAIDEQLARDRGSWLDHAMVYPFKSRRTSEREDVELDECCVTVVQRMMPVADMRDVTI